MNIRMFVDLFYLFDDSPSLGPSPFVPCTTETSDQAKEALNRWHFLDGWSFIGDRAQDYMPEDVTEAPWSEPNGSGHLWGKPTLDGTRCIWCML
jgi:hypothetical protein